MFAINYSIFCQKLFFQVNHLEQKKFYSFEIDLNNNRPRYLLLFYSSNGPALFFIFERNMLDNGRLSGSWMTSHYNQVSVFYNFVLILDTPLLKENKSLPVSIGLVIL